MAWFVRASTDCASEHTNDDGTVNITETTSNPSEGSTSDDNQVGWRFTNVTVPQSATIRRAWVALYVTTYTTNSGEYLTIYGEDADDSAAFSTSTNDVSGRTKTTATENLRTYYQDQTGATYIYHEVTDIVQEIVNRTAGSGWQSGNDMTLIGVATGTDIITYQTDAGANAPQLVIDYDGSADTERSPSANTAGAGGGFTNPTNAYASNDSFATWTAGGGVSHVYYDFNIADLSGATIDDIVIAIEADNDGTDNDDYRLAYELSWNGGTSWTTIKHFSQITEHSAGVVMRQGAGYDGYSHTFVASDLTNANFRVRISAPNDSDTDTWQLDHLQVQVFYTSASGPSATVNDTVSVAEDVAITNTQASADVFDSVAISESVTIVKTGPKEINVFDSITISEAFPGPPPETIFIGEQVTIELTQGALTINVNDSVSVSEDVAIENAQLGDISVSEDITITELVSIGGTLQISVTDSVTATDNSGGGASNDGYDTIGSNDYNTGGSSFINEPGLLITTSGGSCNSLFAYVRNTTTTNNRTMRLFEGSAGSRGSLVATTNSASVSTTYGWVEFTFASTQTLSAGTYWIQFDGDGDNGPGGNVSQIKYDTGGATDSGYTENDFQVPIYNTNQYSMYAEVSSEESLVTVENTQLGDTSIFDAVSIAESVSLENTLFLNVNDTVTLTESVTAQNTQLGGISVSDTIPVSELLTVGKQIYLSVSEDVTITDVPTAQNTQLGGINVSDDVAVSEDVTAYTELNVDVAEDIAIAEDIQFTFVTTINVSDDVALSENVTVGLTSNISVFDSVAITENVVAENTQLGGISVNDTVSITELVSIGNNLNIDVSEAISIADSVTVENVQLGGVSVFDSVAIAEAITFTGSIQTFVSNDITITESVTVTNTDSSLEVSDTIAISESVTLESTSNNSVSDDVTIADVPTVRTDYNITVFDSVSVVDYLPPYYEDQIFISENIQIEIESVYSPSIVDTISVAEDVQITNTQLGDISVTDNVAVSEDVQVLVTPLNVAVSDDVVITELVAIGANLFISVNNTITLSEDVAIENTQLGGVSVFDTITITESVQTETLSSISVSENVVVSEDVVAENTQLGGINVSDTITFAELTFVSGLGDVFTGEDVTVSEDVQITMTQLGDISVFSLVSISEDVQTSGQLGDISVVSSVAVSDVPTALVPFLGAITVNDTVTLSEQVTIENTQLGGVSVFSEVTIAEQTQFEITSFVSVDDTVTISEDVVAENTQLGGINVSDTITIQELVGAGGNLFILADDTLTLLEDVTAENTQLGGISVFDQIVVTDEATVRAQLGDIVVDDDIAINENISSTGQLGNLLVTDTITANEVITAVSSLGDISVFDTVTVSENIDAVATLADISVSDTIVIDEYAIWAFIYDISVSDSVTINEYVDALQTDFFNLAVVVHEDITLTENVTAFKKVRNPYTKKDDLYDGRRLYTKKRNRYNPVRLYRRKNGVYSNGN